MLFAFLNFKNETTLPVNPKESRTTLQTLSTKRFLLAWLSWSNESIGAAKSSSIRKTVRKVERQYRKTQPSIVVTRATPYGDQKGWAGDRKGRGASNHRYRSI